jgi:hypothetical protein
MEHVYSQIPIFRDWPLHGEGDAGLIPSEVAEYGREHSAHWSNESRIPQHKEPLAFGDVDHSFSTDISRAKKVDSWKQVYVCMDDGDVNIHMPCGIVNRSYNEYCNMRT